MQVEFTGHHVKITEALKNKMLEKLNRVAKHLDHIINAHVTFKMEKLEQIIEAKINVPGKPIFAQAASEDMYKTIDLLETKLIRQIEKYKQKETNHRE